MSPTETSSSTRREIAVEVPVEEVTRETASLIQKYQKLARIPGFRRGHVPASVIRQRFAEDLKSDVVEALVPRYFRKEADKQGLIPVSQPQVTDLQLKDNEPLRFKASFEVMPEIKVEVTLSKTTSGPSNILNPCARRFVRASCHCPSVKASGRVITVTMSPTFNATTWRESSSDGTP